MWIRNKVTNTLQEIHNMDVIKICQKEPDKYEVTEKHPVSAPEALATSQGEDNNATDKGADNKDAVSDSDTGNESESDIQTAKSDENVDYSAMKLNDLRKIAKEKGIQGYSNMDQATLVAVIQAH